MLCTRAARFCALAALLSASPTAEAHAGSFSVAPYRVHLDQDHPSAVVKVRNQGDGTAVVQITAVKWSQDPDGVDRYEPSTDLVLFPKIVEIDEGLEKSVRIGLPVPNRTDQELAMRVYFEQLPVPRPGASELRVGLKVGVPVFFTPRGALPEPRIETVDLPQDTLLVRVRNQGNTYFMASKLAAHGVDSAGATTFVREQDGWYVLAGAARLFRLRLEPEERARSKTIHVSVTIEDPRRPGKKSSQEADFEVPRTRGGSDLVRRGPHTH